MRLRTLITSLSATLLLLPVAACGSDDGGDGGSGGGGDQKLVVLAAASLTGVFEDFADEFEAAHDGVEVEFSFGSSTDLAQQAADGAPGDVLATADEKSMQVAEDADATGGAPVTFATNTMVLVTPPDDPAGITSIDDLDGTTWVRCADEVPCGRVALGLIESNGVTSEPASLEEDVKSTLEKVTSGEADAGFVYATDAIAAGDDVKVIEIADAADQPTSYFIATLAQSEDGDLAQEWIDMVMSDKGQSTLAEAGFSAP
jgi:molybdate transport system substrate-binding protein